VLEPDSLSLPHPARTGTSSTSKRNLRKERIGPIMEVHARQAMDTR
jgi:hypothetical protein